MATTTKKRGRPTAEGEKAPMTVYFPVEIDDKLRRYCFENRVSHSSVVTQAVEMLLKKKKWL